MKRLLAGLALALALVSPVSAASTIAIDPSSDLHFAGFVRFDVVVDDKLKGYEYPMVYVACYQAGDQVYGQLDFPDATFIFTNGGEWVQNGGGAADCTAQLWAYGGIHHSTPRPLTDPLAFHVEA